MMLKRIIYSLLFVALLSGAQTVEAAAAYVSVVQGKDVSGACTAASCLTLSSVNGGGGNVIFFALTWRQNAAQTASTPTYNGSTTGVTTIVNSGNCFGGGCGASWYLCNPSGTANVVFPMSASANVFGSAIVLSGVDCAGTPVGTTVQADSSGGSATSTSSSITTNSGGLGVDVLMLRDEGTTAVVTASGQVERARQSDPGSMAMLASTNPSATAMGWDWTAEGSLAFVHLSTPFNASAAGGSVLRRLLTVGVGDQ